MSVAKYEELAHPSAFKAGADRERRRIRRAQRDALGAIHNVRKYHPPGCPCQWCLLWTHFDAATRAKRSKHK